MAFSLTKRIDLSIAANLALCGRVAGLMNIAGVPLPLILLAVIVLLGFWLLVSRTPLGRAFYAVGGNVHAAVHAGISLGRKQFAAFVLSGALAGFTGYLWVARYAVAYVDIAGGFGARPTAATLSVPVPIFNSSTAVSMAELAKSQSPAMLSVLLTQGPRRETRHDAIGPGAGIKVMMLTVDSLTGDNRERDLRTALSIPFRLTMDRSGRG